MSLVVQTFIDQYWETKMFLKAVNQVPDISPATVNYFDLIFPKWFFYVKYIWNRFSALKQGVFDWRTWKLYQEILWGAFAHEFNTWFYKNQPNLLWYQMGFRRREGCTFTRVFLFLIQRRSLLLLCSLRQEPFTLWNMLLFAISLSPEPILSNHSGSLSRYQINQKQITQFAQIKQLMQPPQIVSSNSGL